MKFKVSLAAVPTYRLVIEQPVPGDSRVCQTELVLSAYEAQDLIGLLQNALDETGQA